jgi:hypothetical protein
MFSGHVAFMLRRHPISTLVVVVEMSKMSWLVSGVVPGVERQRSGQTVEAITPDHYWSSSFRRAVRIGSMIG